MRLRTCDKWFLVLLAVAVLLWINPEHRSPWADVFDDIAKNKAKRARCRGVPCA